MAHIEKFSKAAIGHMLAHYDRKAEHIGNECVNRTRSYLNYNLAAELQPNRQGDFIKQRCSEVKVQNRKDVNLMCTWVVTVPKDLPENEHKDFFKATFNFLSARYGKENVISAYVHMDETTPHIHFAFIPVVADKKKGGFKVSAKERINRGELRVFHADLEQALSSALGHSVGMLNEATKNGNKTITELKRETAILEQEKAEKQERIAKSRTQYAEQKMKAADERIETARMKMLKAERQAQEKEHDVAEQIHILEFIQKQTKELQQEQQKIEQQIIQYQQKRKKAEEQVQFARKLQQQEVERMAEELAVRMLEMNEQIKNAETRLSELQGQILTAEQVKDVGIKKAPFGMALLQYQDALNLKRTAERVEQADGIINREDRILSTARKNAEQITNAANKKLEETEHLLELRLSEVAELEQSIYSLIKSKNIARKLSEEEKKQGLIDRETLLKNANTIKRNYEQSQANQPQRQPPKRKIRR